MSPLNFEPTGAWHRAHAAAQAIEEARDLAVPKLSQREAAERAGITPTYWPVLIRGWRLSGGVQSPVVAPDGTLLRMAKAVGIEADVRNILANDGATDEGQRDVRHMSGAELLDHMENLASRLPPDDPILQKTMGLLLELARQRVERETDQRRGAG